MRCEVARLALRADVLGPDPRSSGFWLIPPMGHCAGTSAPRYDRQPKAIDEIA
jgi:hypothetical protein